MTGVNVSLAKRCVTSAMRSDAITLKTLTESDNSFDAFVNQSTTAASNMLPKP